MLVSREWLAQYVNLDMPLDELAERLTMAGLNHEETHAVGDDVRIDLEITSNRPDCLGHLGVAREIGVLFDRPLSVPPAAVRESAARCAEAVSVSIECPDLCPQYHARLVKGVKIGPSPAWMVRRLETALKDYRSINNVVDVTNYVLLECGQPLHAFDFRTLRGGRIVVRRARAGEKIVAIDGREYPLDAETCVIADAQRPVAVAGVMGGLDTEIGPGTVDVLVETADFSAMSVRSTARKLGLHSPSSYRFERGVDQERLDWASRRCCELILDLAGGELLAGSVVAGRVPTGNRPEVTLRFAAIRRLLGIDIPAGEAVAILRRLGLENRGIKIHPPSPQSIALGQSIDERDCAVFVPPSWRRDLTREADLVEEVARIHGYDAIPADVPVPLGPSARPHRDRVLGRIREALQAVGMYEAVTVSFTSPELAAVFDPHSDRPHLTVEHSSRRKENVLRHSLIPSLLVARRDNERHGNRDARLFETAKTYLSTAADIPESQAEPVRVSFVTGAGFAEAKGIVETLVRRLARDARLEARPSDLAAFAAGRGCELWWDGERLGWLGELDRRALESVGLGDPVVAAELDLDVLERKAVLVAPMSPLPKFPAVARDLNFVLDDSVPWDRLAGTVRAAGGPLLDAVAFGGQYRGKQIDAGRKSYVATVSFRDPERTLTTEEVDAAVRTIVETTTRELGATLRG